MWRCVANSFSCSITTSQNSAQMNEPGFLHFTLKCTFVVDGCILKSKNKNTELRIYLTDKEEVRDRLIATLQASGHQPPIVHSTQYTLTTLLIRLSSEIDENAEVVST